MNEEKKSTSAELTDEQLEQATGGYNNYDIGDYIGMQDGKCPNCGSTDRPVMDGDGWICRQCGTILATGCDSRLKGVPTL